MFDYFKRISHFLCSLDFPLVPLAISEGQGVAPETFTAGYGQSRS
jgi:hypothetical protein